jgi:predicted nucleotide-binding protein
MLDEALRFVGQAVGGAAQEAGKRANLVVTEVAKTAFQLADTAGKGAGAIASGALGEMPRVLTQRDVFVIHGHGHEELREVKQALLSWGLKPIILKDQPGGLLTIKQKFEKYAYLPTISFAVALFTPDDECTSGSTRRMRPRQNVLLELGFFMSAFHGERTCILKKGDVEIPSDIAGVVPVDMDAPTWKERLQAELGAANVALKPA